MILCVDLKFLLMVDGLPLQKTVTKKIRQTNCQQVVQDLRLAIIKIVEAH